VHGELNLVLKVKKEKQQGKTSSEGGGMEREGTGDTRWHLATSF